VSTAIPTAKLVDVAELNPPLADSLNDGEEVAFMPMSAVDAESVSAVDRETRLYSEVSKGYTPFLDGDVLVAKITPCFENGKIAHAHLTRRYGFGSTEFHVVRPRPGRTDARYLVHFLRQDRIRRQGESRMTGSAGQRRVPESFLAGLSVPAPPLPEQRRIAEILDKADALRAKRRAALAQLDILTQSIFLDMFGDPILNTRGWPKKKLSELGTVERGVSKHRPRNAPELLGGPYPFVQTGDVANCDGYIRKFTSTYSEAGLRQSRMWPAGTLCITIAANIAKTGVLTFEACFPDSVVGFCAADPATVEFVRGWLSFLQASLEDRAPESAQKNINLEILRGLDVPTPERELQRAFTRRIAAVERLKTADRGSLAELDTLFASLQNRAFRGEL
jgi:type I restriction enzyme S subunit